MKGHKPLTQVGQVGPSASEFPLWGSEIHRVILIKGEDSIHPHKGNRVTEGGGH